MTKIKDLIKFVSWCLHVIENVEAPINSVMVVGVVVSAHVTHAGVT